MGLAILVSGADGFIGSHLVERLLENGHSVRALCFYNSFGSRGWLDELSVECEIILGDVRDRDVCKRACEGIDVVINLAALVAIPYSYNAPNSYIETNVFGAFNMAQAALECKVQRFIQMSTSEVYGSAQFVPISEVHPLQPQSPYSASKISADSVALSFYHSYGLNVVIARPFNCYGPRQSARAVIPSIMAQMLSGVKEIKLGSVTPTRDFTFVLDTCRALEALACTQEGNGEVFNIGSNFEISIEDLFYLIRDLIGSEAQFTTDESRVRPEKSEVSRLWCDNSKIKKAIEFTPRYSLTQGLLETLAWLSQPSNLSRYRADIYNI